MNYWIYKITNKTNNKSYIGKTTQKPEIRWKQHILGMGYGKQMPIHLALTKYKKENFTFEVIYTCKDETDMNFAEVYFINKYTSLVPYGYNLDFSTQHLRDNPYLIGENNNSSAVQSIDSEPANAEYNLSTRTRYPVELWNTICLLRWIKRYAELMSDHKK